MEYAYYRTADLFEYSKMKYPGRIFFGRIVIDKNLDLARRFDVRSSMTFLVFKNGKLVDRIAGLQAKNVLGSIQESLSKLE